MFAQTNVVSAAGELVLLSQQGLSLSNTPFWVWWLVPVVATFLVVGGLRFLLREYRPRGSFRSVADFDRFRETMHHRREAQNADQRE